MSTIVDFERDKMKRAAIYARVSKAYKEDDERTTIESQLVDCEKYCNDHGYAIVDTFIEKDKYRVRGKLVNPSGTRKDRPQYQRMLKAAKNGEFDVIVAWKEDRLYRGYSMVALSDVLDEVKSLSVELVLEHFDIKMMGIKAAMAKIELDDIRTRMVRGRRAKLERGELPGGESRYGYFKNDNNQLEIDEGEAQTVRQIFEWYNQGINSFEIRSRLAAADIPGRKRKVFPRDSILNILYFEGYATGSYTTTLDGESFTIPCPPIISMDTWQKALETREGNKQHRGRNVKEDYLIRGMVYCLCGWKWTARTARGYKGVKGKWGYYGCAFKDHKSGKPHPDCPGTIGSKKADEFVWNFILKICRDPRVIQEAIDRKIKQLHDDQTANEAEADRLQRELDKITEERQWVITQARKGRISNEDMDLQLGALHFQALDLRKKHNDYTASLAVWGQAERLKQWAAQYLENVDRGLQAIDKPIEAMTDNEIAILSDKLGAVRFEQKFSGDKMAALRWAILEEKRRIVRTLLSGVLVVKGKSGEKLIIPQLALDIPREFASLVYDDQSLAYVEEAGKMRE